MMLIILFWIFFRIFRFLADIFRLIVAFFHFLFLTK
jgi:hypothetical protein